MSARDNLKAWHHHIEHKSESGLDDQLAEDAVFHSPVVHTPQAGKPIVMAYLSAADVVLGDIISWNEEGKIQDFKVMVRPLKAINKVWEEMGKMLETMKG